MKTPKTSKHFKKIVDEKSGAICTGLININKIKF